MRRWTAAAVVATTAVALAACSDDRPGSTPPPTSPESSAASASQTAEPSTSTTPGPPQVVTPGTDLLDWAPAPGTVKDTVTVSGQSVLTVDEQSTRARLEGPQQLVVNAGRTGRVAEAAIDGEHALVVVADRNEERPATATVLNLTTGERVVVNGRSEVPTTTGGTFALGAGQVAYASYAGDAYCLAQAELASGATKLAWCAPDGYGFNQARITQQGLTLLTFDDAQPSCRTVAAVAGGELEAFPGLPECVGWDGVLLDGGRVWSEVPNPRRIDAARFYASVGDTSYALGRGTSGSLVACGGSAYFSRDPAREGDAPQVLRWTVDGSLDVVYEGPAGRDGFMAVPLRCGGSDLTVTSLTSAGDEQVTAPLR